MIFKDEVYRGANGKESLIDLEIPKKFNGEIIIFLHGFMGFKDWGAWHLVQAHFTNEGFGFCKFNTTHNGGTIMNGIDFSDLDAFKKNTYTKEIEDVKCAIDWINAKVSKWNGHLIGHSKGGAVALIAGKKLKSIASVATWAAIASIGERFPIKLQLEEWKKNGVRYIKNGRTHQELPQSIDLYNDYKKNEKAYNLQDLCLNYVKPVFIAHGEDDNAVPIESGQRLAIWTQQSLYTISNANHVFQSKHPWTAPTLPPELRKLCNKTIEFIRSLAQQ